MHKICAGVHFAPKDLACTKNLCAVCFYQRFLQSSSRRPSVGVRFNFALFAPHSPACCQTAQYRLQSVILNTHRDTPPNYRRRLCVCVLYPDFSAQLQALRLERGAAARVVNCESKTVNRIWSRKRSGAWCMDWRRAAKTH